MKPLPWNWRQRLDIKKTVLKSRFRGKTRITYGYELAFAQGFAPRGCCTSIGDLQITDGFVDSSNITFRFRGRGLGKLLYETALNDLGSLTTRYHHISDEAKRVWQGMCRRHTHETDYWDGRLTVFKDRGKK